MNNVSIIDISKMRERCSGQVTKTYLAALGKHRFAQVYSQRFRVAQNVSHLRVRRWYFSTPVCIHTMYADIIFSDLCSIANPLGNKDKDSNGIN